MPVERIVDGRVASRRVAFGAWPDQVTTIDADAGENIITAQSVFHLEKEEKKK